MKSRRWGVVGLVAVLVLFASLCPSSGCGSASPAPEPATVRGRLIFNGQPVVGGLVVFAPDPQRGGRGKPAYGETGPDGRFQLQFDGSTHIPPGWYRVALAPAAAWPQPLSASAEPSFPARLARPDQSGILREVLPGTDHDFAFLVETPEGAGRH
ncbi:MAG: hypothetical protein RMJ56_06540 [Gemmataceae bacterium]|nr:DUF4198 domain-containing protein [Gemmata sp.]MDW8197248.1 hypothetical protein [Gemmataceae bacterium]